MFTFPKLFSLSVWKWITLQEGPVGWGKLVVEKVVARAPVRLEGVFGARRGGDPGRPRRLCELGRALPLPLCPQFPHL